MVRALFLASVLSTLALVACGSAGSGGVGGGPYTTASPALGTNNPAPSPTPSDPYSEPGY